MLSTKINKDAKLRLDDGHTGKFVIHMSSIGHHHNNSYDYGRNIKIRQKLLFNRKVREERAKAIQTNN